MRAHPEERDVMRIAGTEGKEEVLPAPAGPSGAGEGEGRRRKDKRNRGAAAGGCALDPDDGAGDEGADVAGAD